MAERRIIELANADEIAHRVADWLAGLIEAGTGPFSLCLSGGSTPKRLFALMAAEPYRSTIPWDRLHVFMGDERVVPESDPNSNAAMSESTLLSHVPIDRANVHLMPTDGEPEQEARAYERTLQQAYGSDTLHPGRPLFDVVLLGLGKDGHTASLFPGKPAVEVTDRWVAAVPEAGQEPYVPRLSLTLPAIASSRHVAFLVSGADKVEPLRRVLAGEPLPSGRVTSEGEVLWYVDRAAMGH